MNPDHPDSSTRAAEGSLKGAEGSLNELLNDLSFEPTGGIAISHQAPGGLQQRIVLAQQAAARAPSKNQSSTKITSWLRSPWRAVAACAAPLLFGVLLGSNTTAAELYASSLDPQSYPDNDQLLVIGSLDSDFTTTLGEELLLDWATDSEPSPTTSSAAPKDASSQGVTKQ